MADPARRLATYDDLRRTPDHVRAEIVHGALVTAPAPLPKHSKVQGAIRRFVGGPFDDDDGHGGPGGWWILLEVDVRLGRHDIVRPDLAGWRRSRLPNPWETRPLDVVPDWICEVTSPSNARHDRLVKTRLYADYGVPALWLVDPDLRIVEALALNAEKRWVDVGRFGDGDVARIAPFDAIELDVTRLFPPLAEPPPPPSENT